MHFSADQLLTLDRQLCFALYSASRAMTRVYQPLLAELGLTYPQYLALLVLWEADGITLTVLGERLQLDSGTLSPLLKRLQASGLITRQRGDTDERQVFVTLTAAGQALKARARSVPKQVICATACDLGELSALTQQVQLLRHRLTDAAANYAKTDELTLTVTNRA